MVLANAKTVRVEVPANNEATRICLCTAYFYLSLSRLGGFCRTCQTTEVFIVGGERFDFGHETCVGGGERGNGGGDFLKHRLFVCGGVIQVVEIALKFLVLDRFSSGGRLVGVRVLRRRGPRSHGSICAAGLDRPI